MALIEVMLAGNGTCRIVHKESGAEIRSSVAPEYGGAGGAFSSTDLLAAALGSCIATSLEPVAQRHGIPLDALRLRVEKTLSISPRQIERLAVTIRLEIAVSADILIRLKRAAQHCVVHQSLAPDLAVSIDITEMAG